ncbi:hypothetical protein KS4_21910 [Poriferisphaera corsica]|uniref:Uncharacterized protein n=1 Tax=Poriferisphaera corsica TaxID=2528020 RepID=A0A517YV66_9BACT|nr:hypothetical protein [Poriferisphaera corsica]QDU34129.1 hypothetical protein KS4_21910 [Poriferisphaera corsica]
MRNHFVRDNTGTNALKSKKSRLFVGLFLLGILAFFTLTAWIFTSINRDTSEEVLLKFSDGNTVTAFINPMGDVTVKYVTPNNTERLFIYSPNSLDENLTKTDYEPTSGLLTFTVVSGNGPDAEKTVHQFKVEPNTKIVESANQIGK